MNDDGRNDNIEDGQLIVAGLPAVLFLLALYFLLQGGVCGG